MGTIANLSASLRWDLDDFQRGTGFVEGTFNNIIGLAGKVGDAVSNAGRKMTAGLTLPLAGLGVLFTKTASDASELQSAFDYTFGAMAGRMNRWAEESGDAMGRATSEMQQGALAFGQLFKAAAPTEAAAARLSQRFTELAQDAASFYNTDFDTAMGKIRSGLTGESEPLRDFGVFLDETSVKAKAVEMGLVAAGQEVNEYGKIMARSALIAEGLAAAQGDVDRTSSGLANRVRKIRGDLRELAEEIGGYLEPYAQKLAGAIERVVGWFKALPEGVKRAAVGFGIIVAAVGPLSIALSALAVTILPMVLVNMGPLFAVISGIVNPIGTLVVMAGKLATEFGGMGAVLRLLGGALLRVAGPIGIVVGLLQFFGDDILRGMQRFGQYVSNAFGNGFRTLFASLRDAIERVSDALQGLMETPFGEFLQEAIRWIGIFLEGIITVAGYLTGTLISAVFEVFSGIVDIVGGVVETIVKLLTMDWAGAWDAAVQTVGRAIIRIGQWVENLWPWLGGMIQMLGRLTGAELSVPGTPGKPASGGGPANDNPADLKGGNYAAPGKPAKPKAAKQGRAGTTAEDLAEQREAIKLEQQLAVAREANDRDAIRALERKRDLLDRIDRYERAGLSNAAARTAAEKDMVEIDQARRAALEEFLSDRRVETEYQIAVLNNDYQHLRYLDEEEALKDRINELSREGMNLASAETTARAELAQIEEARADAAARRLRDQQAAHEMELARLRGDSEDSLRARDEDVRLRERIEDLTDGGRMSRTDAEAQAMREAAERSQAQMQGTFRDAFRNGLHAAMDGNLGDFFEGWMRERSFNALSRVLDRLADSFANLLSNTNGGGGGLFGAILGAFGLGGSKAPTDLLGSTPYSGPGFASGGSFRIKGHPGIDKNLLSLNGNPIARVSSGEIMDVRRGEPKGGGGELSIRLGPGLEAEWMRKSAGQTVQIMQAAGPGMMSAASAQARRDAARPAMPGGLTG